MPLLARKPKQDPETPGRLKLAPDVPPDVDARLKRGQARLRELAPGRDECWEFFRGNTYTQRTKENQLVVTASGISVNGGDPPHRVRTKRPILTPLVRQEVSYATQRVPGYQVTPTNTDPETVAAAKASEKIAIYGYEKWSLKAVTEKLVTGAIVADEAYAWPYWDDEAGPVLGEDAQGEIRRGEVCVRTYTSNQVGWEPGVRFEDSRWWFTQTAQPVDEVLDLPGILVSELNADARTQTVVGSGNPTSNTQLVLVTEYLERPSAKHSKGRRITVANTKRILPVADYPLQDAKGDIVNEPVLLKLCVIVDPDSDHDHGLVKFVLDPVRSYQEAHNKALQYSKHMLAQMIVPPGTQVPFDDTPMAVFEHPRPNDIKFRESPGIPRELFEIADRALADVARAFSQNEIPAQVEAGRAIQALIDRDTNARASFVSQLESLHARLMHRCLNEVARGYDTPRLITITGDFGTEIIPGFKGASLLDQTMVRVQPGSLESKSREQVKQDVGFYAQLQWIGPEDGIAAIQDGTTDAIGADFEFDRGRAYEIIQNIKAGPNVLFGMLPEFVDRVVGPQVGVDVDGDPIYADAPIDPMTGQPVGVSEMVKNPGWMPREVDNTAIHKAIFARWMKSAEWPRLDVGQRRAAYLYVRALDAEDQLRAQKRATEQAAQAQGFGAANAAAPQVKPMPSLPNPAAEQNPAPPQV